MYVVHQLIEHFYRMEAIPPDLQQRLKELELWPESLEAEKWDSLCCEIWCRCGAILGYCWCDRDEAVPEYHHELENLRTAWSASDAVQRQRPCRNKRGGQRRRREASIEEIRMSLVGVFDKWQRPAGRLAHLTEVGSLLTRCESWQTAGEALLSHPAPMLVQQLARRHRYTIHPLFRRLEDLDLVLGNFARRWRGQAGAALRRLVERKPDKRCRKLLKHAEFRDAAMLAQLAEHVRAARQH